MNCDELRDDQWERLKDLVPGGRKGKRGPRTDNRRFLNALLWMARSGGRWRDLPANLGDYETVKRRYYRWIEMNVLDEILVALAREADLEWLMIDSTIVRAHQHAAGASRQKGGVSGILCAGAVSHHALTNLSSNMMANWVLASHHSRVGIFHVCAIWRKTRYSNLIAASSVGKCPLVRMARRSLAFKDSMAFVV